MYHICADKLQGAALTRLALQTLRSSAFGSMQLLDSVRNHMTLFLDDPDVTVCLACVQASYRALR